MGYEQFSIENLPLASNTIAGIIVPDGTTCSVDAKGRLTSIGTPGNILFNNTYFSGTGAAGSPISLVAGSIGLSILSSSIFNVANGIPQLDANLFIKTSNIPIDNTTITVNANGKLQATTSVSNVVTDGVYIGGSGSQVSPISLIAGSITLDRLNASVFNVANGIPKLDSNIFLNTAQIPIDNVTITVNAQGKLVAQSSTPTTISFNPTFFSGTGSAASPISLVNNSITLTQLSSSIYNVANGIPQLNAGGLIGLAQLPVGSNIQKGVLQVDGTTVTATAAGVISATAGSPTQAIIYGLLKLILLAGTNVTLTPSDVNNTITISASGAGPTPQPFAASLACSWDGNGLIDKPFDTAFTQIPFGITVTNGTLTSSSVIATQSGTQIGNSTSQTGNFPITNSNTDIAITSSITGTGTQGGGSSTITPGVNLTNYNPMFWIVANTNQTNLTNFNKLSSRPSNSQFINITATPDQTGGSYNIYLATVGTIQQIFLSFGTANFNTTPTVFSYVANGKTVSYNIYKVIDFINQLNTPITVSQTLT